MAYSTSQPRTRRFALYGLILLALGLLSAVAIVLFTEDTGFDSSEVFGTGVLVNMEKQPSFVFPEELRSTDLSLNRFIDRFFRLCAQGQYPEIRLMLSQRSGEALPPSRFESMFNAMKEARIKSIIKLPENPQFDGPAYVLTAEYDLEAHALKAQKANNQVRLLIHMEDGGWRLGPASRDLADKLDSLEEASTQPADPETVRAALNEGKPSTTGRSSSVTANKPVRLDPAD